MTNRQVQFSKERSLLPQEGKSFLLGLLLSVLYRLIGFLLPFALLLLLLPFSFLLLPFFCIQVLAGGAAGGCFMTGAVLRQVVVWGE